MSWLTKWFIDNTVAANLLMFAIIVSGVLALGQLRVESFPQIAPSSISITVLYPGGTAAQIDKGITQRVEESISGIAGIKQVVSQSTAGLSTVTIRKTSEADIDTLLNDVRNRVNAIVGFPELAERPMVAKDEFTNLAAFVVVSAPRTDGNLQLIAKQVEVALKKHADISRVDNWGSRSPQLIIEPDPVKLAQLGMTLEDFSSAIEQFSQETRSGELASDSGRLRVKGDGYADSVTKLKQVPIIVRASGTVRVGDIANVYRDYEQSGAIVRNNGENAIALLVSTSRSDNLLHVSAAINETLEQLRKRLPADVKLSTMADMAPYIEEQLFRLGDNAWQGLLIVIVLLGLFLDLKLAFWVSAGIPVALFGTLGALQLTDHSINDITLFGFILVLGILVDDAVVVGEAIHDKRGQYKEGRVAAFKGVQSVSVATIFGALTTIAAFSPMLWINNELAKLLAGFSVVVIIALLFSLIESKFILPAHLAPIKNDSAAQRGFIGTVQAFAQSLLDTFKTRVYQPMLALAIRYKVASLLFFIAFITLAYGMWSTGAIRSAVFPEIPGRYVTAKVSLQDGAPLPLQSKALAQLEQAANRVGDQLQTQYQLTHHPVVNLLAWSDGYGDIEVTAELTSESLSLLPSYLLTDSWREQTGAIEGAYSVQFSASDTPAGGTFISISAPEKALAKHVGEQLSEYLAVQGGVSDIYDDADGGQVQIQITLNEYGQQLGLTQHNIAKLAGEAFGHRELHRILDQGQETKVLVRYAKDERQSIEQLKASLVTFGAGQSVRLEDVASFSFEQVPEVIHRRDRTEVVNVYWKQNRHVQSPEEVLANLQSNIDKLERTYPGVKIKAGGEFEEITAVSKGFKSAMLMTLILIYMLLAIPLKSYWQPFIIMAVIPFGFAGAIFGHYIMDLPISLLSMFGMMAMTGIVINDSLVLITRFNHFYRGGMALNEALIKAGTSRFRAIFLTTITTVCGLLPLLFEQAEQAQYLKPAAVALVFGELFATAVTLILIPILLGLFCRKQPKQQASLLHGETA
ncbi:efflux RND transporter permease subunit [Pseudoalteromonas luteoviolacea]|uniref:efflux RND transporter permease subunit n=1 Tax=Pseudoalteromonas luteoviolacea TaxID=43657 RepID=UPI001B37B318|nr:efflux RND transporter permease subunit [Pseudoalteromonas luteoviolacea]MBQ4811311.1 efflux RND transporter permease subunit [Pseudoalteromonas luteoviolacea]